MFDDGRRPIKLNDEDTEGKALQQYGITSTVYGPDLWDDAAAMRAIMSEDNLDADCRLGESELDAFGRVHALVETMGAPSTTINEVMNELENVGFGNMQPTDMRILVTFRLNISRANAEIFKIVSFT